MDVRTASHGAPALRRSGAPACDELRALFGFSRALTRTSPSQSIHSDCKAHLDRHQVVRIVLAGLLLFASALKVNAVATEAGPFGPLAVPRWFEIGLIQSEIVLGVWLLSGFYAERASCLALGCFGSFAVISGIKAASGAKSCGCFPGLEINPFFSLGIDLGAVAALLLCSYGGQPCSRTFRDSPRRWIFVALVILATGAGLIFVGAAPAAFSSPKRQAKYDVAHRIGGVFAAPIDWIGKRLPLLDEIDVREKLATRPWVVVFHRQGCDACEGVIEQYKAAASRVRDAAGRSALALVLVPEDGISIRPQRTVGRDDVLRGRLAESASWKVRTPLVLVLNDGRVVASPRDAQAAVEAITDLRRTSAKVF